MKRPLVLLDLFLVATQSSAQVLTGDPKFKTHRQYPE